MMRTSRRVVATATITAGVLAPLAPATAIECRNGYQRVAGNEIATPYCQDEYLAVVARDFGIKTTGAEVRRDWGRKREICRLIGQDNRVRGACASENDQGSDSSPSFN
jgi:hypothetical protein